MLFHNYLDSSGTYWVNNIYIYAIHRSQYRDSGFKEKEYSETINMMYLLHIIYAIG